MTIRDYIISKYETLKPEYTKGLKDLNIQKLEINSPLYIELKHLNYVQTIASIGKFLYELELLKDTSLLVGSFETVLNGLLWNCMLDMKKPLLKTEPYGYTYSEYMQNEYYAIEFLEGYIKAQLPNKDVYWWIELGLKLNILNLTK